MEIMLCGKSYRITSCDSMLINTLIHLDILKSVGESSYNFNRERKKILEDGPRLLQFMLDLIRSLAGYNRDILSLQCSSCLKLINNVNLLNSILVALDDQVDLCESIGNFSKDKNRNKIKNRKKIEVMKRSGMAASRASDQESEAIAAQPRRGSKNREAHNPKGSSSLCESSSLNRNEHTDKKLVKSLFPSHDKDEDLFSLDTKKLHQRKVRKHHQKGKMSKLKYNDEDLEIARSWKDYRNSTLPWYGRWNEEAQANASRLIRETNGLNKEQMLELLEFVKGDDFWKDKATSLVGLRSVSKNGEQKIVNVLNSMLQRTPKLKALRDKQKSDKYLDELERMVEERGIRCD